MTDHATKLQMHIDWLDSELARVMEENQTLRRAVGELLVAAAKAGAPLEALLWAHKGSNGNWDGYLADEVQRGIDNGVVAVRDALVRWKEYVDDTN